MAAYCRGMSQKVTCRLTACTPGSAQAPMLGNEYGKTLLFLPIISLKTENPNTAKTIYRSYPAGKNPNGGHSNSTTSVLHAALDCDNY